MRQTVKKLIVLLAIIVFSASQHVWAKVEYQQELFEKLAINQNAIPRIKIPDYRKIVLKNGMIVYLVEDHDFPVILLKGLIRGGRSQETPETAGISDFMTDMMNTGTATYTEPELTRYKQLHAISFNIQTQDDQFNFDGNALVNEQKSLLSLAAEMLRRPKFKTEYFNRTKTEWIQSLNQEKTKEDGLLNMHFYRNILKGHVYSFETDLDLNLATLGKITPENLENYYQQAFLPNRTILFVYGDFQIKAMERLIQKSFGSWNRKEISFKTEKARENKETYGRVLLINKPDATQAKIKLGYQFVAAEEFDTNLEAKVAFDIGNQVFGGGDFESYLMEQIRSSKGYAYDISADYFCSPLGGAYYITTSVKPEKAYETVATIKQLMTDLKTGNQKIGEAEVFKIINQRNAFFPESFRYKEDIINNLIYNVEIKNRSADWLNQYIRAYNQVTATKAQAALAQYISPEKIFTVIIGKPEAILPQFKEQGIAVTVINN